MDAHLALPDIIDAEDVFAADSDISDRLVSEIDDWLGHRAHSVLNVWASVSDIVELSDWALTPLFKRWTENGRRVRLILPTGSVSSLDAAQVLFLRDYNARNGLDIAEGEPVRFRNGGWLFAYVTDGTRGRGWASRDPSVLVAGPSWGANHAAPIAHAPLTLSPVYQEISRDDLKPKAGAAVVILDAKLDGPVAGFGASMASQIRKAMVNCGIGTEDPVIDAKYQDRYARSPIVLKLLIDTVASLNSKGALSLSIVTAADRGGYSRTHIASDIISDVTLSSLARDYGAQKGLVASLSVGQLAHKRSLSLQMQSGATLIVDLDQGFGWLEYVGRDKFLDPNGSNQGNVDWLRRLIGRVQRRHAHDSQMVVWRKS